MKKKFDEYWNHKIKIGQTVFSGPEELVWDRLEDRHRMIDFLSGKDSKHRSPSDSVQPDIFEFLSNKLKGVGG